MVLNSGDLKRSQHEFYQAYGKWKAGEITATAAIVEAGMKRTTFYKLVREIKAEEQGA
jgi:hypothetical protein